MSGAEFGGLVAGVALCAFGYFLYTKVKASKAKKATGSGGGPVDKDRDNQVEK